MVLRGNRYPSPRLTTKLCDYLKLDATEEGYFRDLLALAKARGNEKEYRRIQQRISSVHYREPRTILTREQFLSVYRWYFFAIREMVKVKSFREDADWIAKKLEYRVTSLEVRDAIRTLLRLKLLSRDEKGALCLSSGDTDTSHDVADEGIKRFHEQVLENARLSIRKHPPILREFYGTTLTISQSQLPQAKQIIRRFHDEFTRLIETNEADSVYQMEICFFPLLIERGIDV